MLPLLVIPAIYLAKEAISSITDNVILETVSEPAIGSVVYCDLLFGTMEHSGVYVGNNEIIHYNKHGIVEKVSPEEFIDGTTAISIYVGCMNNRPIGSPEIAKNAKKLQRSQTSGNYSVILNNCHQFTETCVTGKESSATFLWMLKHTCENNMGVNKWRVWNRTSKNEGLNMKPTKENLLLLEQAIKKQEKISQEQFEPVFKKTIELGKFPSMPQGGLFFETRLASWNEKYERLQAEIDSLQRIYQEEEKTLKELKSQYKKMEQKLYP